MKLYLKYLEILSSEEIDAHPAPRTSSLDIIGLFVDPNRHKSNRPLRVYELEVSKELFEKDQLCLVVVRYYDGTDSILTHGYAYFVGLAETTDEGGQLLAKRMKDIRYKPWEGPFAGYEKEEFHILKVNR